MKRRIITITEDGAIYLFKDTQMTITEIVDLFEVDYPSVKKVIRKIEKQGLVKTDHLKSNSYVVENNSIYPDYYGLEMTIALSFQIQSMKTKLFREWILQKLSTPSYSQGFELKDWNRISLN